MKGRLAVFAIILTTGLSFAGVANAQGKKTPLRFAVSFGAKLSPQPVDGRLLLILSKDASKEPRFQVSDTSLSTAQIFGIDADGMKPGEEKFFDAAVLGYPLEGLAEDRKSVV